MKVTKTFRIAKDCGITSHEEHKEVLHFIHTKMGVIRYFQQNELNQIVFLDPQVLFDKVTELITSMFTFEKAGIHVENIFNKGIFSFSDLEEQLCADPLLSPSQFAKLLEHLRIAAPFNENGSLKYFFPCAIAHAQKPHNMISSQSHLHPIPLLVVSSECGYRPMGLAGALITYVITNERQSKDFKWKFSIDYSFRDQVSFFIEPSCDTVILKLFPSHLEVTFIPDPNDSNRNYCPIETVCHEVRTIQAGIGKVNSDINYIRNTEPSFTFYCQVQDCKVAKPHPAKLYPGKLSCRKSEKSCSPPEGYKR